MNKLQAYHNFWSGFGLKAYDETSVPDNAQMPYITYEVVVDDFDNSVGVVASTWYRDTSWAKSAQKVGEIAEVIGRGGKMVAYDGGGFWIKKANPWAQRLPDDHDDSVRRIVMNLEVEFID